MLNTQAMQEAQAMAADLRAAETLADLDQLYSAWLARFAADDNPDCTFGSARAVLVEHINNFCRDCGIPLESTT